MYIAKEAELCLLILLIIILTIFRSIFFIREKITKLGNFSAYILTRKAEARFLPSVFELLML